MAASILHRAGRHVKYIPGLIAHQTSPLFTHHVRHHARWLRPFLFALRGQLKFIKYKYGEEPKKPRSHLDNWDYTSEIYAFRKRFGEEFQDETIRNAFTHRSYVEKEERSRREMGLLEKDATLQLEDNSALSSSGYSFTSEYIMAYIKKSLPKVPEDGIRAIHQYLLSREVLTHITANLGIRDLILCAEFPVPNQVMESTFMAIIGALLEDQGVDRAGLFVRDFIITQLMDKDFCDLWHIDNPMGLLVERLAVEQRPEPESRLLREAGKNTITPLFVVGVYSDKKLLGWAPGESLMLAEEEAARVALRNLLDIPENRPPLPLDGIKHRALHQAVIRELEAGSRQEHQQQISAS